MSEETTQPAEEAEPKATPEADEPKGDDNGEGEG
jgi:hypothetical protein